MPLPKLSQAVPSCPACPASSPRARNSWKLCLVKRQQSSCSNDVYLAWWKTSPMAVLCPDMPESLWNDSHAGKRERERESNESNDAEFSAVVVNAFNMWKIQWSCVSNVNRKSCASSWYVIMGKESFQAPLPEPTARKRNVTVHPCRLHWQVYCCTSLSANKGCGLGFSS